MSIEPEYALWTSTRTRKISAIGICMAKCGNFKKDYNYRGHVYEQTFTNGYVCEQKFAKSNKICFVI